MKTLLSLALLLGLTHSALADVRVYRGDLQTLAGESQPIELWIDLTTHVHEYGDPEIPDHGFIRHYMEVTVYENGQSCSQALYLDDGLIRLCSGGRLQLAQVLDVIKGKTAKASLFMNGFKKAIGSAELQYDPKAQEEGDYDDAL
jgi:hypothetical protein